MVSRIQGLPPNMQLAWASSLITETRHFLLVENADVQSLKVFFYEELRYEHKESVFSPRIVCRR